MSPRSAANSNWVPLGGRHEVPCTQILAAAALCTAMDTRKTTTHMKAPLPGHLKTSPSEAHARGCGPVGLAGYKRYPIGRAHSTIWGEGILSRWNGCQIWGFQRAENLPFSNRLPRSGSINKPSQGVPGASENRNGGDQLCLWRPESAVKHAKMALFTM